MIILLLVISILLCAIGGKMIDKDNNGGGFGSFFFIIGGVGFVLSIISLACLIETVASSSVIDDKIAMYQEENTTIESQIDELVKNYMSYESGTLSEFKSESSITLVSLYPELKSDTLVQTQITTYTENNNKIKELKEELIMRSVYRWWLYFGK